jgi:phenylalanyl-tRNA synthetase alpha chain
MSSLNPEDRPAAGKAANEAREKLNVLFENAEKIISNRFIAERLDKERLDVTMPGKKHVIGHTHPLTQVIRKIEDIFIGLGYQIAEGPEIESVHYNFDQLNTPENHPSKDEQDTFYFNAETLLRTQTSPVQARVMEKNRPPIRIFAQEEYTDQMKLMQHIHQYSTRLKLWLLIKILQWVI